MSHELNRPLQQRAMLHFAGREHLSLGKGRFTVGLVLAWPVALCGRGLISWLPMIDIQLL